MLHQSQSGVMSDPEHPAVSLILILHDARMPLLTGEWEGESKRSTALSGFGVLLFEGENSRCGGNNDFTIVAGGCRLLML